MRLHEQRDELLSALRQASDHLVMLECRILRKIASPYGDGSRSNMVNAESDVLPQLVDIRLALDMVRATVIADDDHARMARLRQEQ